MQFSTQPYLLTLAPDREMNILWLQSERTEAFVEFGYTEALGSREAVQCYEIAGLRGPLPDGTYGDVPGDHPEVPVWQYIATLRNLIPGKKVYYRCCYGGEYTKLYDFRTAPEAGEDFRFVQISDLQALPDCNKTVHQIGCFHPDFILFSGDAAYHTWRLDQWVDLGDQVQDKQSGERAFFPCMQQENGARLMQYAPLFFSPGNHEPDYMQCSYWLEEKEAEASWSWSIFMQLFRPLYLDPDQGIHGVRWYSATYGDMHIVSLSINRMYYITPDGRTCWPLMDSIAPDSPQIKWLREDLEKDQSKFKWVIQHFHLLNKAWDAKFNLCEPVWDADGNATYPNDWGSMLMDIFSENGVNGVTYGHSHVYERYFVKGTHYIEAAYLSITFAKENAEAHPIGEPVMEDNSRRSFAVFERKKDGLFATGYYAAEPPIPFDRYQIADEEGNSVSPA